jgi:hypothetical protein
MKRTLTVLGTALAAVVLAAGPAAAGERHHDTRSAAQATHPAAGRVPNHQAPAHPRHTCSTKCRPAPLPKPPGGWPCAKDHSCSTKHHRPICPPPVTPPPPHKPPKHHRPPVVAHPRPPIVTHPKTPVAAPVPQLPRTGPVGDVLTLGGIGVGAIALGLVPFVLTRRPKAVTDAIRGELG